jgi:hypothetical protein
LERLCANARPERDVTTISDELLERFHVYLASIDDALVRDAVARIRWDMPGRALQPRPLACLRHLDRAADLAPALAEPLVRLLAQHRDELHWGQTYSEADFGQSFVDNYGWLEVFGTRGHFANADVAAGILVLGPDVVYPDHHHVAEEIYIPLTGGTEWRKGEGGFLTLKVAPFKPQNMSNNAAVAVDGGEIGRAQAVQARAARLPPSVHMNPVLLKPETDTGAQVIVQGKRWGTLRAKNYLEKKAALLPALCAYAVLESFSLLADQADIVLIEGAGSPAEINLRAGDIANMGFAAAANIPVVLAGDIDRGGVIASLAGTHLVLEPEERARIHGFIVNKFRGDPSLFDNGLTAITRLTGWPSIGVLPWLPQAAFLPAEDAVDLDRTHASSSTRVSSRCRCWRGSPISTISIRWAWSPA